MIRLVCLSDTHTLHGRVQVPDGDALIVAGDFCGRGTSEELHDFAAWLADRPHRHKIVVAGNHDWCLYPGQAARDEALKSLSEAGAVYLQDSGCTIDGLHVWGSPWQPEFCSWAFNLPRGSALADRWALIPEDTEVLVTHGPAYRVRDETWDGRRVGCRDLARRVEALPRLKLHVFGHIHAGYGEMVCLGKSGNVYRAINAAICTERYAPDNAVFVVDLETGATHWP